MFVCSCCRGQILCSLGDELGPQLPQCLPIFLDRLRNEITRLTTVKAYSLIAGYVLQSINPPTSTFAVLSAPSKGLLKSFDFCLNECQAKIKHKLDEVLTEF